MQLEINDVESLARLFDATFPRLVTHYSELNLHPFSTLCWFVLVFSTLLTMFLIFN